MGEALAELGVGLAKRLLGIDLHEAREVDDDEEQVADLVLDVFLSAAGALLVQFADLLVELVEDLIDILPVEADSGRLGADLLRLDQGRLAARNALEEKLGRFVLRELLFGLDLVPALLDVVGRFGGGIAEDVGMAANQLLVDGVERVCDGETAFLRGHLRVEDALQHEVAQLLGEFVPVALIDGVEDLVGLFERVGLDGVEGLVAIPRAAAGRAQLRHQLNEALEFLSGGFHEG